MAGANFKNTPPKALYVQDCWVIGIERLVVGRRLDEEEYLEIRTEWSDESIMYLRRNHADLQRLVKGFGESFPEDRGNPIQSRLLEELQRVKEAGDNRDTETRLDAVEKLLRSAIQLPPKYSQSEAVLSFFEACPLDRVIKTNYDPVQPFYRSPVTIADIRRSNGFCLANIETIIYDGCLLEARLRNISVASARHGDPARLVEGSHTVVADPDLQGCFSSLAYLQMDACETDILE